MFEERTVIRYIAQFSLSSLIFLIISCASLNNSTNVNEQDVQNFLTAFEKINDIEIDGKNPDVDFEYIWVDQYGDDWKLHIIDKTGRPQMLRVLGKGLRREPRLKRAVTQAVKSAGFSSFGDFALKGEEIILAAFSVQMNGRITSPKISDEDFSSFLEKMNPSLSARLSVERSFSVAALQVSEENKDAVRPYINRIPAYLGLLEW